MEKIGLNQLREMFLNFYATKHEHYRRASFSLVPNKDKSLLIINSGMAPLKPYFAGLEEPPSKRMTTCQKCIRTDDIENVGFTSRHGTFFEMLGSFSFGDYFKKESLKWGWEFVTEVLKLPEEKLWATIYEDDDDAYDIWVNEIGIDPKKIVRLGKDDNFWEIGTGPCGPCSEIYYDRGVQYGCDNPNCAPGCDCDRYIEFWNHVFTQFSKQEDGSYVELEHKNIDTGMGLERLACIMQEVDSIFDIDTIRFVLNEVCSIANIEYGDGKYDTDVSVRIITDHIRSATFMIGDTIVPSNEGRGYVLRRLIRRSIRHGRKLGVEGYFLSRLVNKVIESSYEAYPELKEQKIFIEKIITQEEERFSKTLQQGLNIIDGYIYDLEKSDSKILDGVKAFKLHDTYGFPFEITKEILEEKGYQVDDEGFAAEMQRQKELGKSDAAKSDEGWKESAIDYLFDYRTTFTGYDKTEDTGIIVSIFASEEELEVANTGDIVNLNLSNTPFYARGGGQLNDFGTISNNNFEAKVLDVRKIKNTYAHKVEILSGTVKKDDNVSLNVDIVNRNNTSRNHTVTHLLHKALRIVLGEHVQQAGSYLDANTMRFDFSHFEAMSSEQLAQVESIVNEKIYEFIPVTCQEMPIDDAKALGAMGLFEDKYGDTVRVVTAGDFSIELCGGIHVSNTGQIGSFKIISESGIAAGVRRIEAVTGRALYDMLNQKENTILEISKKIKAKPALVLNKIDSLLIQIEDMNEELDKFKNLSAKNLENELMTKVVDCDNKKLLTNVFDNISTNELKTIIDNIKSANDRLVIMFITTFEEKSSVIIALTDDLVKEGLHSGKMIKEIATILEGKGGGKSDLAQAGATNLANIDLAINKIKELIK
ncbi:MAG: alanine--tRNA ligase [Eubacteriales bacterium]|nr:alanine--tRNA ligase [Eubacteriales bacterium]MDY3332955.1 alanine--tRNA ligase [Gallibacter sp.]